MRKKIDRLEAKVLVFRTPLPSATRNPNTRHYPVPFREDNGEKNLFEQAKE